MKNVDEITIEYILNAKCGDIFENNETSIRSNYRKLVAKFHPDVCDNEKAYEVIAKLSELKERAYHMLSEGNWEGTKLLQFTDKDTHKVMSLVYKKADHNALGSVYLSDRKIVYMFKNKYEKYYNNFIDNIQNLKYDSQDLEKEFRRYFPKIVYNGVTNNGQYYIILDKTSDVVRIKDLISYTNKLEGKHSAWIISRLCNIACYLALEGIVHNGITLDNCYVSTEYHTVCLFGGWEYAVKEGSKMLGAIKEIVDLMSPSVKTTKIADIQTDLESIRNIGRKITKEDNLPKPFSDWLNKGSSNKAVDTYGQWVEALEKSYGQRKFTKFDIDLKGMYN